MYAVEHVLVVYAWIPCQTDAGSTLGATLFFITTHAVVTQSSRGNK